MITKYKLFEIKTEKEQLIKDIKSLFEIYEEMCYSSGELMLESSPLYQVDDNGIHLIENFCEDKVNIIVYELDDDEVDKYTRQYEDLNYDILIEILDGLLEVFNMEKDNITSNMVRSENEYNKVIAVLDIVEKYELSLDFDTNYPDTLEEYKKISKAKKFNL